jgi:tetratricopeptide (TPR) repeat protein
MKRLKAILILAGISILFSCVSNVSYPDAMQKAIRCMEECPDSARIYLSSLDSTIQFEPEETRMYYGLLTTKAQDKKFIRHKSDSLMKKVVRFYKSHGDKEKLMEAYYYLGSVYRDMKDAPQAVAAFQQAADIGKNSQRYDILGRIYSQMGTLLAYQSLYEDALKIYKISYAYNLKREAGPGLVYALRDQGRMYESLNQLDSAEYYYQVAYKKAFELNNQRVINAISTELGFFYLDLGKIDSAKNVFSRIPAFKQDAIYLQTLARSYQLTSQPDSAEFYYLKTLQKGIRNQSIYLKSNSYKALAKLEAHKGNYHSAFDYAQKSLALEDTIKKKTRTEAIGKINALYNYRHTEQENQQLALKNKQIQIYIYLLIIAFLVIGGIVAFYFNYLNKQKRLAHEQINRLYQQQKEQEKYSLARQQENEKRIQEIKMQLQQANKEDKKKSNSQIQDLKNKLSKSDKRELEAQQEILELSNKLIDAKKYETLILKDSFENSPIYKLFHTAAGENSKAKIKEEDWVILRQEIDRAYDDFTNRLKALFPPITEHELRLCYLIKSNIPPTGMAQILSLSTSAISNGRSRLYKKIYNKEGKGELLDKLIVDF